MANPSAITPVFSSLVGTDSGSYLDTLSLSPTKRVFTKQQPLSQQPSQQQLQQQQQQRQQQQQQQQQQTQPAAKAPTTAATNAHASIGYTLSRPFLRLIPAFVNPNTITFFSLLCNVVAFALGVWVYACASPSNAVVSEGACSMPWQVKVASLVACGMLNMGSMICDCLDGMHARATGQCSKLGEILDHSFDAINTVLVVGSVVLAVRFPIPFVLLLSMAMAMIYFSQLCHQYVNKEFSPVDGEEGQILVSSLWWGGALLVCLNLSDGLLQASLLSIISLSTLWSSVWDIARFSTSLVSKGNAPRTFSFVTLSVSYALLYLCGAISLVDFVLLIAFTSLRISGSMVLHTVTNKLSSHTFYPILAGPIIMALLHYATKPIHLPLPLSNLVAPLVHWTTLPGDYANFRVHFHHLHMHLSRAVTSISNITGVNSNIIPQATISTHPATGAHHPIAFSSAVTVQQLFPLLLCALLLVMSVSEFRRIYRSLPVAVKKPQLVEQKKST